MPYNNFGQYYSERHPEPPMDPFKMSAEQFVKNVESFLYDTASPVFMDPQFLAWAIRQYDLSKHGSGRVFDVLDYESGKESIDYLRPPIPHPGKSGKLEYRVQYTRGQFNDGEVPTSVDGTQPDVQEHHVYQIVQSPEDGLEEMFDKLGITFDSAEDED